MKRNPQSRLGLWAALVLLCGFGLGAGVRPPGLADVTGIRTYAHPEFVRVVVDLSREVPYETHMLKDGRFYIDIQETWIEKTHRTPVPLGTGRGLRRIRGGQNTLRRARVVMELDGPYRRSRTFHLADPYRIVTDLYLRAARSSPRAGGSAAAIPARPGFDSRPVRRVVIDPGHGGKDPGATGARGTREKDVVLRVARGVRERLRDAGLEAHLTRDSDVYLSLEERTARANQLDADVFVSIHANASRNRKTRGIETYLLDTRYDRQTARLAARENGTTVERLDEVQRILASLKLGYRERFAAPLARQVQGKLYRTLKREHPAARDLGVKHGPFLVLFLSDMPSILVETGFLSNRSEEQWLRNRKVLDTMAEGIAAGILAYRDDHGRRLVAGR